MWLALLHFDLEADSGSSGFRSLWVWPGLVTLTLGWKSAAAISVHTTTKLRNVEHWRERDEATFEGETGLN